jgi:excisionase family DNA binding protein
VDKALEKGEALWMTTATLTTSQVARRLGVSAERIRQLTRAGRLSPQRTALGCLYDPDDVERLALQRRTVTSEAKPSTNDAGGDVP